MNERWLGPLRLVVGAPAGWAVRAPPEPLLPAFCEPPPGPAAPTPAATIHLELHPGERAGSGVWEELVVTAGWVLHGQDLHGQESSLRWTLPEQDGSWFWRVTIGPSGHQIEVGARLVDESARTLLDPVSYPLDQIIAIHELGPLGGLLLHAAGFARDGRAVVAAGVSGAGKTTLSRLLRTHAPELLGLSDDRVIVAPTSAVGDSGDHWEAWGTPWAGEGRIAAAATAELGALVVLRHAQSETLTPLSPTAAFERLLPATSIPWYSPALADRALANLEDLVRAVPAWELAFRPLPEAAELVLGLVEK